VELLEEEAVLQIRTHRNPTPPYGLAGGSPGTPSQTHLIRGGERVVLPAKTVMRIGRGDRIEHITASGGGIGAPAERDAAAVRADLAEGRMSARAAREVYGYDDREQR
jgi:N-methylhydantoinase B